MTKGSQDNERPRLYCMYRGPGAAAYQLKPLVGRKDHCITKQEAPAYTIGIPYKFVTNDTPGPAGNYDPYMTSYGRQVPPSAPMGSRPATKAPEITPGPGQYEQKLKNTAPVFSFGEKAKTFANANPAPNAYKINSGIGAANQFEKGPISCMIRSRSEVGSTTYLQRKAAVPGPATYGPVEHRVTAFTLKDRFPRKEYNSAKDAPGPGAYRIPSSISANRGCSMGVKHSEYMMPLITYHDMY
jgi:hypothetical protein